MYMRIQRVLLAALSLLLFSFIASNQALAVPAFARQTANECSACHYQHFAKLTPFGRAFKSGGYSLDAQELLENPDDTLSIPPVLNLTFFMRSKYQDEDGTGTWGIPDEAAILAGGRLAEGAGGMVEWGGPLLSAKASFTRPVDDHYIGMTVFTTDGLGAGYGFEVMNTGAVRNHRPFEQSSKPTLGNNGALEISQAATGITFFGGDSHYGAPDDADWFVAGTIYTADSNEAGLTGMDSGTNLSTYLRAAYMPNIGGFNYGFGIGVYSGTTRATMATDDYNTYGCGIDTQCDFNTSATFVDFQMEGPVGGKDLGLYFMYAEGDKANSLASGEYNLWGGAPGDDKPVGWGLDLEYSMTPKLHLLASYGQHDDGSAGNSTGVGVGLYWQIYQNIALQPMFESFSGDQRAYDNLSTLTLETAF